VIERITSGQNYKIFLVKQMSQKHTILIVDDDQVNLNILKKCLERSGYLTNTAMDGKEAMKLLEKKNCPYVTVLLDRMMPGVDGIKVLKKMKKNPNIASIPVILQTALGTDEDIREGQKAGSFYYLTKPFKLETVVALVRTAINDFIKYQELYQVLEKTSNGMAMMEKGHFTFRTMDEARQLAAILANCCPDPSKIILGLSELIINAVEHGSLQISYHTKSKLLQQNKWANEISARLNSEKYAHKTVSIKLLKTDSRIEFSIKDQGQGFDWRKYLVFDPERALDSHGRGILMAKEISFDNISYKGNGNEVVASINL
jgi:CheY-like chemotaxis protein